MPLDYDNPLHRAVAWSSLIEPGDDQARALIDVVGTKDALKWALAPQAQPLTETDHPRRWQNWHQRLRPRAQMLDVNEELRRAAKLGIRVIAPEDPDWPRQLSYLHGKEPLALWVQGEIAAFHVSTPSVAIVGSRASSGYGNQIAQRLAWDLADRGFSVVSGGAYGIDTAAHQGALAATTNDRATVGVLCGGLGSLYPRGNEQLFSRIRSRGVLVSEVPPHWRPARWRFLERNRIIAALSAMTVVVEAGVRSGAIATAHRAAEIGRPLGAVPGPITSPNSAGCLSLLRETDAVLIRGFADVIEELGPLNPSGLELRASGEDGPEPGSGAELVWHGFPTSRQASAIELARATGLSLAETQSALWELQMAGRVSRQGERWSRLD